MTDKKKILIVEDDDLMQGMLKDALGNIGCDIVMASDGREAWQVFQKENFDLVLTDYKLPKMNGIQLLQKVKVSSPETIVIIMTAYGTVESAVQAMKKGAYDYLTKPFLSEEVIHLVMNGLELKDLKQENLLLKQALHEKFSLGSIVGKSKVMQEIYQLLEIIAPTQSTVIIQGESGTGKELIAEAIHQMSPRKNKPLIKVSCAALPETLLESELFGHEKGAFTDATNRKMGRFELADKGTLFLDDIDDMNVNIQVKLLRVLQEKEFVRIGGIQTIKVDVRVIAATKSDLQEEIKQGEFRKDLFYRLNVVPIHLPPLRERREDIPLLIDHFSEKICTQMKKKVEFTPAVLQHLVDYGWPGNIRELENMIERLITVSVKKKIDIEDLPFNLKQKKKTWSPTSLKNVVAASEKEHILRVLELTNNRKKDAAKLLGITPKTLWQKMKAFEL